jgi:molybdopterin synthase sulfur carrier subunit
MRIQVRFFAGLRERLGIAEKQLSVPPDTTVAAAWGLAVPDISIPDNVLAARNMEYAGLDTVLEDGDEVAFFPPVTGGSA